MKPMFMERQNMVNLHSYNDLHEKSLYINGDCIDNGPTGPEKARQRKPELSDSGKRGSWFIFNR